MVEPFGRRVIRNARVVYFCLYTVRMPLKNVKCYLKYVACIWKGGKQTVNRAYANETMPVEETDCIPVVMQSVFVSCWLSQTELGRGRMALKRVSLQGSSSGSLCNPHSPWSSVLRLISQSFTPSAVAVETPFTGFMLLPPQFDPMRKALGESGLRSRRFVSPSSHGRTGTQVEPTDRMLSMSDFSFALLIAIAFSDIQSLQTLSGRFDAVLLRHNNCNITLCRPMPRQYHLLIPQKSQMRVNSEEFWSWQLARQFS